MTTSGGRKRETQMNRDELIDAFASAGDRLRQALAEMPAQIWDFKPAPECWSIRETAR